MWLRPLVQEKYQHRGDGTYNNGRAPMAQLTEAQHHCHPNAVVIMTPTGNETEFSTSCTAHHADDIISSLSA